MRARLLLVAAAWGLGLAPLLAAQDSKIVGGSGGTRYLIRCPVGSIVTGLRISSGAWIDRITPFCAQVKDVLTGSWDWNKNYPVGGAGKEHLGNTTRDYKCAQREVLKGFRGTAGNYVNSLILQCYTLGRSWGTWSFESRALAKAGGSGGTSFDTQRCGGAMPAVGIQGRAGAFVDAFGLVCEYILPIAPTPKSPVQGAWIRDNPRPTFYWSGGAHEKSLTICLNRTTGAPCSAPGTLQFQLTDLLSNSWTPAENLPYLGNPVYWSLNACNDNGCRVRGSYFNYTP